MIERRTLDSTLELYPNTGQRQPCFDGCRAGQVPPTSKAYARLGVVLAISVGLVVATTVSALAHGTGAADPWKVTREWLTVFFGGLGPTLVFIAAIFAALYNARRNREQAEHQADLDRAAEDHRAELEIQRADQLRKNEAAELAHSLIGEVNICRACNKVIIEKAEEYFKTEYNNKAAIVYNLASMQYINFPRMVYEKFLDKIGLLESGAQDVAIFYSRLNSLEELIKRQRCIQFIAAADPLLGVLPPGSQSSSESEAKDSKRDTASTLDFKERYNKLKDFIDIELGLILREAKATWEAGESVINKLVHKSVSL